MKNEGITLDVKVNNKEVKELINDIQELDDILPNIVVKNNENVYITINHFKSDNE